MAAAFRFPAYNYANFINDAAFVNNPYAQRYDLELERYAEYALDTYPTKCPNRTSAYGGTGTIDANDLLAYTSRFYANYYNFLENPVNYLGTDGGALASFKLWNDAPLIVLEDFELHGFTIGTLQVTNSGNRIILNSAGPTSYYPHGLYHGMKLTFSSTTWSGLNGKTLYVYKENAFTVRLYWDSGLTNAVNAGNLGLSSSDATYTGTSTDTGTIATTETYRYKLSSGGAKIIWNGSLTGFGSIQPVETSETINGVVRKYVVGQWSRGWRVVRGTVAQSNPPKWFREGEYPGNTTYTFEQQSQEQEQLMINSQLFIDNLPNGTVPPGVPTSFDITTSNDTNPYANYLKPADGNAHQHWARVYGWIEGDVLNVISLSQGLAGNGNIETGGIGLGYHRIMTGATIVSATTNPNGNPLTNTLIEYIGGSYTGGATVAATAIVAGKNYTINGLGTTNWTAIGAPSNSYGITFTATGAGTGTGTAICNTGTYKLSRYYSVGSEASPVTFTLRDSRYDLGYFPRIRTGTGSVETSITIGTDNTTSVFDGINSREYPGRFRNNWPVAVFAESLPSNTVSNTRWKGQANDRQWEYAWETDTSNRDFGGQYDNAHNSPVKQWPRHIRPAGMTWSIDSPTRVVESQNMTRWTRDSGVYRWRFKLKYPPMTREQFLPFFTALHTAHGQARGFRFYIGEIAALTKMQNYAGFIPEELAAELPAYEFIPSATPGGADPDATPTTTTQYFDPDNVVLTNNIIYTAESASAGDTTLLVEGLQPGVDNALNAGDMIKIQHNTNGQTWWDMYLIINSANTDELGRAIIRLSHPLKTSVSRGGLCYTNPDHVFVSLNNDTHDYSIDTGALHGFEVEFILLPQMNDTTAQDRGIV
jgi:hypothetical protein